MQVVTKGLREQYHIHWLKKNTTPKRSVMLGWLPKFYEAKPNQLELVMSEF